MDTELLLQCDLGFTPTSLNIHAPNLDAAKTLRRAYQQVAMQALKLEKLDAQIFYPGCKRPWQIPARMAMSEEPSGEFSVSNQQIDLLGADYAAILHKLMEWREEGRIVAIVDNNTDICMHTNDLLKPSRAIWTAAQFTGYNYALSWRIGRDDYSRPSQQYEQLKALLERDGSAPGYNYRLFRPDGALCEYQTDYFLCQDYCGAEVRIGVSRVEDWRLLEAAPV